jgi:hypothetical protein
MLKKIALMVFMPCLGLCAVLFWSLHCEAGWIKIYGGTGNEYAESIQQTGDGGYIVSGFTTSYGFGGGVFDGWIMKLDGSGSATWQKTYGGTGRDYVWSIQQTGDGGYIVAGDTNSFGAGGRDAWIMKLDGSGSATWQKTYGGTESDYAKSIQQTGDGGYIVAGDTNSFGAGDNDAWILKLDGSGSVTWQKTYGGTGYDYIGSIQQTGDGGYIAVGYTESFGAGGRDAWIMKLDGSGSVTWQKTYGGTGYDAVYSIQQTEDGGYIVAGETDSFGAGGRDAWIMKLDGSGSVTWQKTYGGTDYDYGYSIQQTGDGGYVMAGGSASFNAGNDDIWLIKLDGNGSTGSCPFEGISTALVNDTVATVTETAAITGTTSVTGADTTAVPADSGATPTEICPLSDKPLTLKVGATRKRQGDGIIASSDGLIDCPGACQVPYNQGAMVTLSATPSALSTFLGWKPASPGCEGTNPCSITMDKKKSVKAIFQGPNKLKVVSTFKNGATGSVTSGDTFINCPGDCEELYILNAPVTLTANEGVGSTFVKWTGKPCKDQQTNVCTFTMEKNVTVKAIFAPTS